MLLWVPDAFHRHLIIGVSGADQLAVLGPALILALVLFILRASLGSLATLIPNSHCCPALTSDVAWALDAFNHYPNYWSIIIRAVCSDQLLA